MNKMSVSVAVVVAVLAMQLLLQCAAAHTEHVVGDSIGWTVPPNKDEYDNWADQYKFAVGDILIFNFTTGRHDVVEVPKDSYDSCTWTNKIGEIINTGPTNVTLSTTGDHYYICTVGSHCVDGQKLSINVLASHSSPSPSSTPAPMSPGSPTSPNSSASGVYASFFLVLFIVIGMMY